MRDRWGEPTAAPDHYPSEVRSNDQRCDAIRSVDPMAAPKQQACNSDADECGRDNSDLGQQDTGDPALQTPAEKNLFAKTSHERQ